jgi:ATP-binding cassette, subfamily B, heavy metal transporter
VTNKDKKEKIDFKHNLSLYYDLAKKYKVYFIVLILIALILEAARLWEKFLYKQIIDEGANFLEGTLAQNAFVEVLIIIAGTYAAIILSKSVGHWLKLHLMNRMETKLIMDLKKKFFNHIVHLSHNFHTTHKTGSLISRLTRGSRAIEAITDFFLFSLAPLILQLILLGGAILYFDLATAIAVVVTGVVFVIFSMLIINRQKEANITANNAEDREKGMISDIFTNIDSIKYFGKEKTIKTRYQKLADVSRKTKQRHWDYYRTLEAGQSVIMAIGTFFIVFFPILRLLEGELSIGTLAFIYTAYIGLMGPLFGFVWGIRRFYESMADFNALFEYDKIKNDIKDKEGAKNLKVKEGEIEFKKVSFKYHSRNVLTNIDLKIKPGQRVALVGHSGSGKTTLVKLLYRLYDIDKGEILIDGKNVNEVIQESLRSELSIVPQECILFDDTIYNNIAFSRPNATKDEITRAIKLAQLDKFIKNLPNKENTIVGERGVKLSGGEKQRVSIARALLANKKILILDEATSALDSKTEWEIQQALKKLMQNRTSIIIAHRLSTIMHADKIIVMDKGRIVQAGKHRDLINAPGVYRELWNLQKGGYIEE